MAEITLKGNKVNTNGQLPVVGDVLPNHKLVKSDLGEFHLNDFKGHKIILNIFPSIDTSTCATSVRKFNEKAAGLDNTKVICVSSDLPFAHARFCGTEGIKNVVSASDFRNPDFAESLGVKLVDGPLAGLDARSVVVMDENGKVVYTQLVSEISEEPDYEAALAAVQ